MNAGGLRGGLKQSTARCFNSFFKFDFRNNVKRSFHKFHFESQIIVTCVRFFSGTVRSSMELTVLLPSQCVDPCGAPRCGRLPRTTFFFLAHKKFKPKEKQMVNCQAFRHAAQPKPLFHSTDLVTDFTADFASTCQFF